MALSKPLAKLDLALLAGLDTMPLSLIGDGNTLTPDISLVGVIYSVGAYAYQFQLVPGQEYQFNAIIDRQDNFGDWAALLNSGTGEVYWANDMAQSMLGIHAAETPITVDKPESMTLVVKNQLQGTANPFHLDVHVDAYIEKPVEPPVITPHIYTDNAVYRFNLIANGTYFYTVNEAERNFVIESYQDAARFEGVAFFGEDEARADYIPVYRFVKNGSFFYTAKEEEKNYLLAEHPEYSFNGPGFYVPANESAATQSVYRLSNPDTGNYLFTADPAEKLYALLQGGWQDDGVVFNALKTPQQPAIADAHHVSLIGIAETASDLFSV